MAIVFILVLFVLIPWELNPSFAPLGKVTKLLRSWVIAALVLLIRLPYTIGEWISNLVPSFKGLVLWTTTILLYLAVVLIVAFNWEAWVGLLIGAIPH
jgi:hypothetical protein